MAARMACSGQSTPGCINDTVRWGHSPDFPPLSSAKSVSLTVIQVVHHVAHPTPFAVEELERACKVRVVMR